MSRLAEALRRLRLNVGPERYVDLSGGLPLDADLAERNLRRAAACRAQLGSRWICAQPLRRLEERR